MNDDTEMERRLKWELKRMKKKEENIERIAEESLTSSIETAARRISSRPWWRFWG